MGHQPMVLSLLIVPRVVVQCLLQNFSNKHHTQHVLKQKSLLLLLLMLLRVLRHLVNLFHSHMLEFRLPPLHLQLQQVRALVLLYLLP
jgi:hypothetical protein